MIFGQLSNRDSLRDLLVCLNAHKSKHYHLGFGKSISRSNLAEVNEKRDCKIFGMFAYEMIAEAQKTCISDSDFNLSIKGNVYAFDSTTIDLCLNVFWWASFRRAKGCIKLHLLLELTKFYFFKKILFPATNVCNTLMFLISWGFTSNGFLSNKTISAYLFFTKLPSLSSQ